MEERGRSTAARKGQDAVDEALVALMRLLKHASAPPKQKLESAAAVPVAEEGAAATTAEGSSGSVAAAARHAATLPRLAALAMESSSSSSSLANSPPGTAHEVHQDSLRELEERRDALRAEVARRRAAVDGMTRRLWQLHAQTTTLLAPAGGLSSVPTTSSSATS